MRFLEVRRHSFTKKAKKGAGRGRGSHLSADGVAAARRVGQELEGVTYVAVSEAPRTLETAIAMGFAVDDVLDSPSGYEAGEINHHDQWQWEQPFVRYRDLVDKSTALRNFAENTLRVWEQIMGRIPDGGCALVIGHGGSIEPALVVAFPQADHWAWGGPFEHLDGVRMGYAGHWYSYEFRRYQAP
jgi:broad specificity phosphatase PhoE